jgi:Bacteriophage head to tail connecting protein.
MAELPKGLGGVEAILKRQKAAKESYNAWRSLHQEAMDYATPQRETFTQNSEGQRKNRFVYDSTAIEGSEQFSSRIQGSLVPSWQQWASLVSGEDVPKDEAEQVDKELKRLTDLVLLT